MRDQDLRLDGVDFFSSCFPTSGCNLSNVRYSLNAHERLDGGQITGWPCSVRQFDDTSCDNRG